MNFDGEIILWKRLNDNFPQFRRAIAHLLKQEQLRGKLFDFDTLAHVLGVFCGCTGSEDLAHIDQSVIAQAFEIQGSVKISRTAYSQYWSFDDDDEAVAIANSTEYGLVAGVFTTDLNRATKAASSLRAGQVFVNEWYAGGVETPFGGYGRSGYGREKGREALWNYVQTKNIAIRRRR